MLFAFNESKELPVMQDKKKEAKILFHASQSVVEINKNYAHQTNTGAMMSKPI